jgi:hypothetical protein
MTRLGRSAVLGIAVAADGVRALVVNEKTVLWMHEVPLGSDGALDTALRTTLEKTSQKFGTRRRVVVALGPTLAQFRHLSGLPMVRDVRTLSAVVQQSADRYFRQNGKPVVTTPVGARVGDRGWAGAVEQPTLDLILAACTEARLNAIAIVPSVAVLGIAAPDGSFTWHDGDLAVELRYANGRLCGYRALPSRATSAPHGQGMALEAAILALGPNARRFADAFCAARGGWSSEFAIRPSRVYNREPGVVRITAAAAACVCALLLLLVAPAVVASRRETEAQRRLASLSAAAAVPIHAEAILADSAALLNELTMFRRGAVSTTLLLSALTRALSEPTVLLSVRLEPDGGSITALTPDASALLAELENVDGIAGPTIVGAVTPAVSPPVPMLGQQPSTGGPEASTPLERIAVRFRWNGEHRQASTDARSPR